VDDHSRLAYSEILTDEKQETAAGFWVRAAAFFAAHGITVQRVLTDNGSCYRSRAFAAALGPQVKHRRTRPYRPQTNGKVERFNRTLTTEWAYARPYASETERAAAYQDWLHHYNHCESCPWLVRDRLAGWLPAVPPRGCGSYNH
jgi:transposase InsO family protein